MRRFHLTLAFVGAALLGLIDTRSVVEAAHPPAPSPCAADGICRPNATTWGHWNTHWRPWPGDKVALPTPAEAAAGPGEEKEEQLRGFEPPLPQNEDQIGPEEEERAEEGSPAGAEPSAMPAVPAAPAAPAAQPEPAGAAPNALPAIDPQGANHFRPKPPASVRLRSPAANQSAAPRSTSLPLPPSFHKQSSEARSESHSAAPQGVDPPPALPASLLRVAQVAHNRPTSRPHVRNDGKVRGASAEAASGIRIINPAAAVVEEPGSEGLRQAIYLEAAQGQSAQ